jgi:heterodisulfide reductase subunit A
MSRIGVFICHCGENISRTVDVERVAQEVGRLPGVAFSTDYKYMCSDPGQNLLKKAIPEQKLSHVVVGLPRARTKKTFRKAVEAAGLNPSCAMANIREHCSWVHENRKKPPSRRSNQPAGMMVERVKKNRVLPTITVLVTKQSPGHRRRHRRHPGRPDIADCGHEASSDEREPSIGGHMAQLSETFPTLTARNAS